MNSRIALMCAVAPAIRHDFFPAGFKAGLPPQRYSVQELDPAGLSAAAFARELNRLDPEVLVTAWGTPPLPDQLPTSLRYVCHACGTIRELITRRHLEAGLLVTNWGNSISRTIAECALLHILAGLRRTTAWTLSMHLHGGWVGADTRTDSLFERRVGIHGFGRIAQELVKLLKPFSVTVQVFAPDIDATNAPTHGIAAASSLEALFSDNDVVVELAPLIPATVGIIDESLLRCLRPGAVFVNVGRGALVDEAALIRIASEGRIQVGLDVFAVEPLPASSPLRGLPNVSLTPHIAGPTNDRRRDAGAHALANLNAYAARQPLQAIITPAIYDVST